MILLNKNDSEYYCNFEVLHMYKTVFVDTSYDESIDCILFFVRRES